MSKQFEEWSCFHCAEKYIRPQSNKEAYSQSGRPTGLYYCPNCVKILYKYLKEYNNERD